jgi:NAD+ synthase (glutamine-hydrolysing)
MIPDLLIAVAQTSPTPGNVRANLADMLEKIRSARTAGAKLIVFPELATSGYMLGDRWEHDSLIREIESANEVLRQASLGIVVVWGTVVADWNKIGEDGRTRKYNAACIAVDGNYVSNGVLSWIPKTNLPKYRVFDDARHFYPAAKVALEMGIHLEDLLRPFSVLIDGKEVKLGLVCCEDIWDDEYRTKPALFYAERGANLLVDISSSPWTAEKWRARERILRARVHETGLPILYVNNVGLQNNGKNLIWFDGDSCYVNNTGQRTWRAPCNEEGLFLFRPGESTSDLVRPSSIEEILRVQVLSQRIFFDSFPKVVIGLSGGVDSMVEAALLTEAVGREKVLAVNMPTINNGATTKRIAAEGAKMLGVEYVVSPIQQVYEQELAELARLGFVPAQLTRENGQARLRGNRLAGIAQHLGGVFMNNGNKTEVALNYFTLYGDAAGAAAFLADLWKGQIYELASRLPIPQDVLHIPPSAELSPDQSVDEGKGDPIFYAYHDCLLRAFIEKRWDVTTVMQSLSNGGNNQLEHDLGCEPGVIDQFFGSKEDVVANLEWCWRQYSIEYKRVQLPPVLLTSRRAFGFDRRDTIAGAYFTNEYGLLRDEYLRN